MKRFWIAALLVLAMLCGCCGCGRTNDKGSSSDSAAQDLKIGVLFADNADATGMSHYHLLGLQKAVETQKLPELLCRYSVTDTAFDADAPVTAAAAETTETSVASETRTQTASAVSAAAELIGQGCNVIVATDPIYDDLTAYLAQQFGQVTFLQYRGTHTKQPNLQSFADNTYEAFYLAGAVAGCEGVKQIGFTARTGSSDEIDCINAFALGAAKTEPEAEISVRMTHAAFDLYLERTVPHELIETDKCALLAQTVFTALPLSVAAGTDDGKGRNPLPCIGYGYDMQADGGAKYLCSVVFDLSVYYTEVFAALADGTFDAAPYTGGVREGIVGLSPLQNAGDAAQNELQALTESYDNGTLHPLDGFTPAQNGYAANVTVR